MPRAFGQRSHPAECWPKAASLCALDDDAFLSTDAVTIGFSPCLERLVQGGMVIGTRWHFIEYRPDAFGFPFDLLMRLLGCLVIAKRISLRCDFSQHPICC